MTTSPLIAFLSSTIDATIAARSLLNFTISCLSTMASDGRRPFSCVVDGFRYRIWQGESKECQELLELHCRTRVSRVAKIRGGRRLCFLQCPFVVHVGLIYGGSGLRAPRTLNCLGKQTVLWC